MAKEAYALACGSVRTERNESKKYLVMGDEAVALGKLQAGSGHRQVPVNVNALTAEPTVANIPEDDPELARNLKFLVRNRRVDTEIEAINNAWRKLSGTGKQRRD